MKTTKRMFREYKGLILISLTILIMMQLAAINVEKINNQDNQSKTTTVEKR